MVALLHELLLDSAARWPGREALLHKDDRLSYEELAALTSSVAMGLKAAGLRRQDRVAVHLTKRFETVAAFFGATMAGGVFVPVNPVLKSEQIVHILRDCNVRVLITTKASLLQLEADLGQCKDLELVVVVGETVEQPAAPGVDYVGRIMSWGKFTDSRLPMGPAEIIDADIAAIFYTSGSTGKPKGVVLSHRNMVAGARSVAEYLENSCEDRLLAALPFSFDYGFSQLSTAFSVGATVVLMDYLFPRDIVDAVTRYRVTGLAGVPPLWVQLCKREWPEDARTTLRYITNSGGAMPEATLGHLRSSLPATKIFLMYGLTEAFRSTYLPPEELDRRPTSMGKAIPNVEVMVVREDGSPCEPGEPGELVHRGALVALGYWNDPEKTSHRFRPLPAQQSGLVLSEIAVWSGDTVRLDEEGFLYFVGRRDDMIKTSGYRVSPTEVEEVVYASAVVGEAVAVGVPHPELGQAIVVAAVAAKGHEPDDELVIGACREHLPAYMIPAKVVWRDSLPRNPNGKLDRKSIQNQLINYFQ